MRAIRDRIPTRTILACAFVAVAMILGGGGSSSPTSELAVQMACALAVMVWFLLKDQAARPKIDRNVALLAGFAVALPILQLVPLPPSWWQALPGRADERAALELVGAGNTWMPWSISPARTLASLLSLGPPLAAMVMVSRLDSRGRWAICATIAAVALASLLFGALQLSAGTSGHWRPYGLDNVGFLNGFQANRNAQADVLLIGMVAGAAALAWGRRTTDDPAKPFLLFAYCAAMTLGCLLTGSRTGIALILVGLGAVAAISPPRNMSVRTLSLAGAVAVLTGLAALALLRGNRALGKVADRFAPGADFRAELWQDTQFAIGQYWPIGSGLGTFRPAFIAAERLEVVDATQPVRAHNDYLELALEGGLVGLALLAASAIVVLFMAMRAWRGRSDATAPLVCFSLAALSIVALHSIVDYPMRSMALACLAGCAVGLLATAPGTWVATEKSSA